MSKEQALAAASRAQNQASDPAASVWVAANAGSGKTRVLTDRVARLLLDGSPPQNILCLTFTKAAAAEMQARLFTRLGAWAMLGDADLEAALAAIGTDLGADTGADTGRAEGLARARRLFARALETPGGIRIQTIHSFCTRLLRSFPVEAGVSPDFAAIEEREMAALRDEVLAQMATQAPELLEEIGAHLSDPARFDGLLLELLKSPEALAVTPEALAEALGVDPARDCDAIARGTLTRIGAELLQRLYAAYAQSGTDPEKRRVAPLQSAAQATDDPASLDRITGAFLTKTAGTPISRIATKKVQTDHPWVVEAANEVAALIAEARKAQTARRIWEASSALLRFGQDFAARYEALKSARGLLDFDDLIARAATLLTRSATAPWVLYRLDGRIDHILVDEAQDTAPAQWAVIRALAAEFTAGESARGPGRTLFVVGDRKQSIFGFQGADPAGFDDSRDHFEAALGAQAVRRVGLAHSFRTTAPILALVDRVFADSGEPHVAFEERPGRVELWPFLQADKSAKQDKPGWWEMVDQIAPGDPRVALADQIATRLGQMIGAGEMIPRREGGWRPVTAGDVMVLLPTRGPFFHLLIARLKAEGLPVAGADRLDLTADLGVRDVLSLLAFLDNPRDDLSLAEALRSPLFGVGEAELFALAHGREGTLIAALEEAEHRAVPRLTALRRLVDFARPYELIEAILQQGRAPLLARLGPETGDALDVLVETALDYEQGGPPSLSGFLAWLARDETKVKREFEADAGEIRVMTVHGAKGLEAPVVILPDVTSKAPTNQPLYASELGVFWAPDKLERVGPVADLHAVRQEREAEERTRLLYVALTRAESWLILCGAGAEAPKDDRWYSRAAAAMEGAEETRHRWTPPAPEPAQKPPAPLPLAAQLPDGPHPAAPDWLTAPLPPVPPAPQIVQPSQLDGAHALAGPEGDVLEVALSRGNLIHLALERLPLVTGAARREEGARLAAAHPDGAALIEEALACLDAPELAPIFGPDSLAEVPFAVTLADGRHMRGRIDRLRVEGDRVRLIDIKTNRTVPNRPEQTPGAILAQMGAYLVAAEQIWPDLEVVPQILWTATATQMTLPLDLCRAAYLNTA